MILDRMSKNMKAGLFSRLLLPIILSIIDGCSGPLAPSSLTFFQNFSSSSRAPSAPPMVRP